VSEILTPTPQRQAFLDALCDTRDNLALVARAGCGKTSAILAGVEAYAKKFPRAEILVCAYNKPIADEVKGKLAAAGFSDWRQVQAATIHSLGYGLTRFVFKPKIDEYKVRELVRTRNEPVFAEYEAQIVSLVAYAKLAGFGFFDDVQIGDARAWYALAEHHDVNGFDETDQMDHVVAAAQDVYRASLAQTGVIDYDDMILFPLIKNLRVKFTKDLVFVDEAQDLSRARQALARKFVRAKTGRMVVVGDDRQAIYGFAGADASALDNLIRGLGCKVLPLTLTWRCPQAVVREAQRLVPDITAAGEREGTVSRLPELPDGLQETDAILCRNTAPLIEIAYKLIREGVPCKVEGRAIGEGLAKLAGRWKVKTVAALLNRLSDYKEREVQKHLAKGSEAKAEAVADRVDTLIEICNAVTAKGLHGVSDVQDYVRDLFADGARGVLTLATYHRSKGREWERVFLWEHAARCPSRAARQDWQKVQEDNLAYVAITRAKDTLVYIN
jgi:DNA helicase II / ATP-dependent DNA helicase PcrA